MPSEFFKVNKINDLREQTVEVKNAHTNYFSTGNAMARRLARGILIVKRLGRHGALIPKWERVADLSELD